MMITTTTSRHQQDEVHSTSEVIRATALFASTLQPSQSPVSDRVREAVTETLRMMGAGTCAALVAGEFGDHPDRAAARMTWALGMVRRVYRTSLGPFGPRVAS